MKMKLYPRLNHDYEFIDDILLFEINNDYDYRETIGHCNGILLDF